MRAREISHRQTLDTISLCDAGSDVGGGQRRIDFDGVEAANDGWALLGTPNGTSSVWLLMQHGEEAGLTGIESVTYSREYLTIKYKT